MNSYPRTIQLTVNGDPVIDATTLFETDPVYLVPENHTILSISLSIEKVGVDRDPILRIESSNADPLIGATATQFDSLFFEKVSSTYFPQDFEIIEDYTNLIPRDDVADLSNGFLNFPNNFIRVRMVDLGTPPVTVGTLRITLRTQLTVA